ncbi:cyclin-G1-like isoform X2 [Lingula anatina]|uniref:Cyclin-G1-like isoform X2 n=1 Tax=Lingula anatina TaxID=7574 RepID=A0A1S3KCQ9_LINAN|nr:cyclin-G1-like isoform X2 [Lingula anatina]|eukprot:XP_013420041.1 cyclin-G1-like isoform X2 [Lingula anatina]
MGPISLEMSEKLTEERMQQECPAEARPQNLAQKVKKTMITSKRMELWEQLQKALSLAVKYKAKVLETGDGLKRVSPSQRDSSVNRLRCLHKFYDFSPETLALAVNLLDRFLGKVKAHPKYLHCITTSCYYIAIKVLEESQDIPSSTGLIYMSQSGCTVKDLIRMEGIILGKLGWNLHASNSLTILARLFDILAERFPDHLDNVLLHMVIARLEVCMGYFQLIKHQAATTALSVLSCVLEETQIEPKDLWAAVIELQIYCHISDCDFIHCRGLVADYLDLYYSCPPTTPLWRISHKSHSFDKRRPGTYSYTDLPNITEGDSETEGATESGDIEVEGTSASEDSEVAAEEEKEEGCLTGDSGMECEGSTDTSFSESNSAQENHEHNSEKYFQISKLTSKLQTLPGQSRL